MSILSSYSKAYLLNQLREFDEWSEEYKENTKKIGKEVNGEREVDSHIELSDNSIVYLHDNYTVTADIYKDKKIIFDKISDNWIRFCRDVLRFDIPDYAKSSLISMNE